MFNVLQNRQKVLHALSSAQLLCNEYEKISAPIYLYFLFQFFVGRLKRKKEKQLNFLCCIKNNKTFILLQNS